MTARPHHFLSILKRESNNQLCLALQSLDQAPLKIIKIIFCEWLPVKRFNAVEVPERLLILIKK